MEEDDFEYPLNHYDKEEEQWLGKDLFDLEDIADCPEELQNDIRPIRTYKENTQYKQVYELFLKKDTLTLDEIQVGLWRKFKLYLKRPVIVGSIQILKRDKGLIRGIRNGVYRRNGAKMGKFRS